MAYKPGVGDPRGSLALAIASLLAAAGVDLRYHDPLVPSVSVNGEELSSLPLTAESVARADCVLLLCPQPGVDLDVVRAHARRLVDPTKTVAGS
jgi:UDP-N-acetyl-D-glucosamine dehydrogenase